MMPATPLPGPSIPALTAALRSLLRHFHRQNPIRGGSLLITIFGDSIAPRGGAISLGSLITLAQPFELAERLVRTSVARLASDGWLIARRDGRRSEYSLSATGLERFAEATRRIYGEIPSSWNRQWTLLVLPPGTGNRRPNVRDELRWLGFGQVSPGLFAHPNWSIEQTRSALKGRDSGIENALLLKSQSEGSETDRRLVASGWDLGELTRRYSRFVETFGPVLDAVTSAARGDRGVGSDVPPTEAAFVIRTLLIHEYRKIHLQDPLLPPALLPSDWVGAAAYHLSKRLYSAVFAAAERYLSATASTMAEPLPPADGSAYSRFGGVESD
ncbi:MAG TPA: PaaX family transcriptional regulator C-terminal domain-containing protein [Steroidobacteraceae bacterium]